jgi:hypothetical protein
MQTPNRKIRYLPIIGICLTLGGYFFLFFQTHKLTEKRDLLKKEINELEIVKNRLTSESKQKDTIIRIQDTIIAQSADISTVEKGMQLMNRRTDPVSNYFTITSKQNSNEEKAQKFESEGFAYLLEKDVDNAIVSFRKSENSSNGYHMAYDIAFYLDRNRSKLSDKNAAFWKESYRKLLTDYSWKMPKDVKEKLREMSE